MECSIVIPAYNEAEYLPDTLDSVRSASAAVFPDGGCEIIVVDNNSTDETARIAAEHGAGVRVVFEPVNQISRARNTGARSAAGRFLLFLDADTRLSAPLFERALSHLRSHQCVGGGVVVALDRPLTPVAQWTVNTWNRLSQRQGLAAGCFIYCLREAWDAVGGFSERVYAGEEIWFSRRLRRWGRGRGLGFRIIADIPIRTSGRKVEWFTTAQVARRAIPLLLCPWLTRSKRFCDLWYRRPGAH